MKKRYEFAPAFKEDIINDNLPVVTRDGRPVKILSWNLEGNYPIVAVIKVEMTNPYDEDVEPWTEERPFAYNEKGHTPDSVINDSRDLFVIVEEADLFEETLAKYFYGDRERLDSTLIDWEKISKIAEELKEIYRKEIFETEVPHWKSVKRKTYLKDYTLVKKYNGEFTIAVDHTIRSVEDEYDGKASECYISIQELLDKLPKND